MRKFERDESLYIVRTNINPKRRAAERELLPGSKRCHSERPLREGIMTFLEALALCCQRLLTTTVAVACCCMGF